MAVDHTVEETKVGERGMVTISASLRRRLDIEAGDKLRWRVDDSQRAVEGLLSGVV